MRKAEEMGEPVSRLMYWSGPVVKVSTIWAGGVKEKKSQPAWFSVLV